MPANPIGVALRGRRVGHHTLVWARPGLQAPENFTLTSPAFGHETPIPHKHRGRLFGANISPTLEWTQPPPGTAELALIVQDPDVPFGKPAIHALAVGIDPARAGLPENALANPSPVPGIRYGKGGMGKRGWSGPLPPRSHGPHTYAFQLYALDRPTGLPASFTLDDTLRAIEGHVIGRARLDGTYEIR
jgi:Raf kinase inhibitor-like YbhB/YbcL family protein